MKQHSVRMGLTGLIWTVTNQLPAWAATAGGGWPWDQPLNNFTTALTGWPAYAVTALGIIITGFTWAHTHHGVGVMRGTATLAGGALALKALDVMGLLGWTAATF